MQSRADTNRIAQYPWERDHAGTQLRIRLTAFVAAVDRCESWASPRLRRRRRELRRLAERVDQVHELEIVLDAVQLRMEHGIAERRLAERRSKPRGGRRVTDRVAA